jgi:hypothetical protein
MSPRVDYYAKQAIPPCRINPSSFDLDLCHFGDVYSVVLVIAGIAH